MCKCDADVNSQQLICANAMRIPIRTTSPVTRLSDVETDEWDKTRLRSRSCVFTVLAHAIAASSFVLAGCCGGGRRGVHFVTVLR